MRRGKKLRQDCILVAKAGLEFNNVAQVALIPKGWAIR